MLQKYVGDDWKTIRAHTKITLADDAEFVTFHNKKILLKSGDYFIVGFWVNIVGLAYSLKDAQNTNVKHYIKSSALSQFQRRIQNNV